MSLHSRRLFLAGLGGSGLVLSLPARAAGTLTPTPAQGEGPFYPAAFPADADADLVRVRGGAGEAAGQVAHVGGRVLDVHGRPIAGATVEIWQCDAQGLYDHPRQSGRERRDRAFQGYGRTAATADGAYRFRTIRPVAYPGRPPHIHMKVAAPDGRRLTTQLYVAGDPLNERDFLFRAVRDVRARERLEARFEPAPGVESGALAASFDIVLA